MKVKQITTQNLPEGTKSWGDFGNDKTHDDDSTKPHARHPRTWKTGKRPGLYNKDTGEVKAWDERNDDERKKDWDSMIETGEMVGKVSQVKPDGTVEIQKPAGDTTTVQATALQPGNNNKLTMQLPKIQPGMEVDSAIEEEVPTNDPQMVALQKLLSTAQQPWEQAQIKWRMNNLQSQQAMAGEPGGGMGAPVDARGNLIPVLPTKDWMAKNPNIVKQLPNDALPTEMQRPGMLDRMKSLAGIK